MANDFLVSKWKAWYKLLDVNHDGKISFEDVEESRNKFSELHHLEADKKQKVLDNFAKWWNDYIFRGKTGDITESDFVNMLKDDFKADKSKFHQTIAECMTYIFDVIDTNHDRSISHDEFNISWQAYGHESVAKDKKFFNAFNPKDGLVPIKDFVAAWVEFLTSDDAAKHNPLNSVISK